MGKDGDGDSEEKEDEEFNDSSPYCENDCPKNTTAIYSNAISAVMKQNL